MIYTVTLNPALDYVVHTAGIAAGSINRCLSEAVYAGGKGINVSVMAARLGCETTALGFAAGFTGRELVRQLDEAGVHSDFVMAENGFTRINVKIKDLQETDINGHGPNVTQREIGQLWEKLSALHAGDTLVLSGNVPAGFPADIYGQILGQTARRGIKTVVDAEKDYLLPALSYAPFLIKPNTQELGVITGTPCTTREEILAGANRLCRAGARNVLVSCGGDGALLLTQDGDVLTCPAAKGTVLNSTGAGDSMIAGFLKGFEDSGDYKTALRWGVAAGSATAFSEALAEPETVAHCLAQLTE